MSKKPKFQKGFIDGNFIFGVHAHTLVREMLQTRRDGIHRHLFVSSDGEYFVTELDGEHVHTLTSALDENTGAESSTHQHVVKLMDGTVLVTEKGGRHPHSANSIETTGADGAHQHVLVMEDGSRLTSLSVSDYLEREGIPENNNFFGPMPALEEILNHEKIYSSSVDKEFKAYGKVHHFTDPAFKGFFNEIDGNIEPLKEFVQTRAPVAMMALPEGDPAILISKGSDKKLFVKGEAPTMPEHLLSALSGIEIEIEIEGIYDGNRFFGFDLIHYDGDISNMDYMERKSGLDNLSGLIQSEFLSVLPTKFALNPGEAQESIEFAKRFPSGTILAKASNGPRMKNDPNSFLMVQTKEYELQVNRTQKGGYELVSLDGKIFGNAYSDKKFKTGDLVRVQGGRFNSIKSQFGFMKIVGKAESAMGSDVILERTASPLQNEVSKAFECLRKFSPFNEQTGSTESLDVNILKSDIEKQMVFGVVLAPDEFDLQGDIMEAEEIEKTAHNFLMSSRVIGFRHSEVEEAELIESYITRKPFQLNGETVKTGSWVIGVHVSDPETWRLIKNGEITGFSIGGSGKREPLDTDA